MALALMLGAAGLTAACTAGEEPDTAKRAVNEKTATPTTTKPKTDHKQAVVDVINRFHKAVDADNGKRACAQLTKTLQGVYAQNPGASDCPAGISYTHKQLKGYKMAKMKLAASDVRIDGKEAVVSHELIAKRNGTKAKDTDSYNMVRSGKTWKIDYVG